MAQDVAFLNDRLRQILEPAGYELVTDSIDLDELVYHPVVTRPVIIETRRYAVRAVLFKAVKNGRQHQGMSYLLIFRHDRGSMDDYKFNSSAPEIKSHYPRIWLAKSPVRNIFSHRTDEDLVNFFLKLLHYILKFYLRA